MVTLLILNGPPGCGKDYIANNITCRQYAFADKVKRDTLEHYNISPDLLGYFDKYKNVPSPHFDGLTPREAYIHVAEDIIKPKHGSDHYGVTVGMEVAADIKEKPNTDLFIVKDAGFKNELNALLLLTHVYFDRIIFARIYHEDGFEKDSRKYLDMDPYYASLVESYNIYNDKTERYVDTFLNLIG